MNNSKHKLLITNFLKGYASAMFWEHSEHKASRLFVLLISFCYFWGINIFLWIPAIRNVMNSQYSLFSNSNLLLGYSAGNHLSMFLLFLFCLMPPQHWKILGHNVGLLSRLWKKISAPLQNEQQQIAHQERMNFLYEYFEPYNSNVFQNVTASKIYLGFVWWANFICIIISMIMLFYTFFVPEKNINIDVDKIQEVSNNEPIILLCVFVFLIFSFFTANSVYRYGINGGKIRKIFFAIAHIPLFALLGMCIAFYVYVNSL